MRGLLAVPLFVVAVFAPLTAAARAVEHVEVTHQGVTVRASVVPEGARLALTAQLLPCEGAERVPGGADVNAQLDHVLRSLDAWLQKVGGSRASLVRVNLYAATPEAATAVQRKLTQEVACAVSTVVTSIRCRGALLAIDAVAVATAQESPDRTALRLLDSGHAVYISGMAAGGQRTAEATRATLEQLDGVLRHLGLKPADVVHVKFFIRAADDVTDAQVEIDRFLGGRAPTSWVEWKAKGPIEIELVAQRPADPVAAATTAPADTVTYLNPPPAKASPLYSRVAVVRGGRLVFTSGVLAVAAPFADAAAETRAVLGAMREVVARAGGDFEHLVKATYYPATGETSAALNDVRPEFFNPARPPAASKAPARGTGTDHAAITLDLIAVTPRAATTKPASVTTNDSPAPPAEEIGKSVSLSEFEALRGGKDVVVLDVRTPDEFAAGHVPGAANVDAMDKSFADRVAALDKSKTYVVYCQSGRRSTKAAARMKALGFGRLYNYVGSMNEWETKDKPVDKGQAK